MKVWGITEQKLSDICSEMGIAQPVSKRVGKALQFQLRAENSHSQYARRAASGRRTISLCWHGWIRAICEMCAAGATRVDTSQGRWTDANEFVLDLPRLSQVNVGSVMYPVYLDELECECSE